LQELRISPFCSDAEQFNVLPKQSLGAPEFSQLPFLGLFSLESA
jgi:hypothetical protein